MFCLKCGEIIPDGSKKCSNCGEFISDTMNIQTIVYASQKEEINTQISTNANSIKKYWIVIIGLTMASFIFLALNYMSVSIELMYYGSSDTNYTGYYLVKCLGGTARLSGIMVILLIFLNIATIIIAAIGIKGSRLKNKILKHILLLETVLYLIVTIVPYFHMSSLLKEFDSSLSTTSIGVGCYLNIGVAGAIAIIYFSVFSKKLSE